mmetsp:Transcript_20155/g.22468  ORF Transcript_20155/g.22468 Transcript_20155/m.22468 type:complete len:538 (+) Transcript_20155:76-1689(+)
MSRSASVMMHQNMTSMESIEESPYEGNNTTTSCAEVGERLFDYTKSLMDPDPDDGLSSTLKRTNTQEPSSEAIEVFGEEKAKIILRTNYNISASGMLYGSSWIQGHIRGINCGVIDKELLLLCIHEQRLARGSHGPILAIIKDLNVLKIFVDIISEWKLNSIYPRLAKCIAVSEFRQLRLKCLKCIIFIVRVAICMKLLNWNFLALSDDGTLKSKIYSCLDILENNITVDDSNDNNKNKRTKKNKSIHRIQKSLAPVTRMVSITSTEKVAPFDNISKKLLVNSIRSSVTSKIPGTDIIKSNDGFVHDLFLSTDKRSEKEDGSLHIKPAVLSADVPNKKAKISHDLFNFKHTPGNKNKEATKVIKIPKNLSSTASNAGPGYVSNDNCSNNSTGDPNFWFPIDSQELILTSIEIEAAWLAEESIFCNRQQNIDWVFVWKYSSPMLKIKLRKNPDVGGVNGTDHDDDMIAKLLHNTLAVKRFVIVRRDIRRKLLKNIFRPRMISIVPRLRKATHPLRLKKLAAAGATVRLNVESKTQHLF